MRSLAVAVVGIGILLILRTASRGSVLGLAVAMLFFLVRGSMRQRIGLLVLSPLLMAIAIGVAPSAALQRIRTMWAGTSFVRVF